MTNETNPLLQVDFRVPFDRVKSEHVQPAVDALLAAAESAIGSIAAEREPRTYTNTMFPLDRVTEGLDYAMNVVRHLESVATYPELRAAYNAVQPAVTSFYSRLVLNEGLWNALRDYAATDDAQALAGTRRRFLHKTIDNFRRHGAELDAQGKARLQEIDVELGTLTTKFSENVLDSTNQFELILKTEEELAGLPPTAIAAARASAASKGKEGWRFTLQAPSYSPLMMYLDNREVRECVYRAYNVRATSGAFDNRLLILRILELRRDKARLLGFPDFAGLVLDDRMAHTGERAQAFLDDLEARTRPFFERENRELEDFSANAGGPAPLEPWDVGYWAEKQRKALYDFDEEALRPYFPLERVVAGMFEIFHRIFGIRVVAEPGIPGWDPEVRRFGIYDERGGEYLGAFYTDWYPRENKRGGAWMDTLITGTAEDRTGRIGPHLGLICGNLTPPVDDKPALLNHRETETIFHEFGHLLHHCLSRVEVRSLSGTSVAWDFVELPSQIMENWCWERDSLDLFARHYETGEPIPEDLFGKLKRARTFRGANGQMRQLGFGILDLALHRQYSPARDGDVMEYARAMMQRFAPASLPVEYAMVAGFTHLFASPVAYAAGYYSYKWAEVLDADAFTRFRREGIFSSQVGLEFRERILARGDSDDPAELYRSFMGRDPDPAALLERVGLVAAG